LQNQLLWLDLSNIFWLEILCCSLAIVGEIFIFLYVFGASRIFYVIWMATLLV
jgi:hypothetical protein